MVNHSIHPLHPTLRKLVLLLAAVCILVGAAARVQAVAPLTHQPLVVAPFLDDGFYYLQIARNVAASGHLTFDGLHLTNGFHPLWELMLVSLTRFTLDDFLFMRLVMYFSIAWFVLAAVLIYWLVSGYGGEIASLAAVAIWSLSPDLVTWQNQGMENTIFLPILALTLVLIDRYIQRPDNRLRACFLALAFGFLMWSRSDSLLFVLIALAGIVIVLGRKLRSWKALISLPYALLLGITFLFGLGYLLFNRFAAGSFLSVSGVVKLGESSASFWQLSQVLDYLRVHLSMVWDLFKALGGLSWGWRNWIILPFKLLALAWTVVAMVWWIVYLTRHLRTGLPTWFSSGRIAPLLLLVYSVLHSLVLVVVMREQMRWTSWYLVPQVLAVTVLVPLFLLPSILISDLTVRLQHWLSSLFSPALLKLGSLAVGAVEILVVFGACFWALAVPVKAMQQMAAAQTTLEPRYELAMWLKANVPPQSQVGMFDAGLAGYFSHVHVINLDGLVNSPDYVSVRRSGAYARYVIQNRLNYVVLYDYPPYQMEWGPVGDDSHVCHQLEHVNQYPAPWGPDKVNNYFEVMALRYDGDCAGGWKAGFPIQALPAQ